VVPTTTTTQPGNKIPDNVDMDEPEAIAGEQPGSDEGELAGDEQAKNVDGDKGELAVDEHAYTGDADVDEATQLIREASRSSRFLQAFDAGDIASLATSISVVTFDEGEQILAKGEPATWVGIVLKGELAALVDGQVVGTMGAGKIVGEVAFFAGGLRMANVVGSAAGFIAFMTNAEIQSLFAASPSTGAKLVNAFGASSLHQLAHNPSKHVPLKWNMSSEECVEAATRWQQQHFGKEVLGLEPRDADALVRLIRCHRFEPHEHLIDRFADNMRALCFVVEGSVQATVNGAVVHTFGEGAFLDDLRYFDATLLNFDTVGGAEGGIIGGITVRGGCRVHARAGAWVRGWVCVCLCACVRVRVLCVRARVRACVCVRMRVWARLRTLE
jgi:CRP-like cAMP-binding protein